MTPVAALWVALFLALPGLELLARIAPRRLAGQLLAPLRLARQLATSRVGRAVLFLVWAFAGIHLFARHRLVA